MIRRSLVLPLVLGLVAAGAFPQLAAAASPAKAVPMPEQTEIPITCTSGPVNASENWMFESAQDAASSVGTWHYKLWLPKGYAADASRKWPCMFVMSPDGNAAMGEMADHLKPKYVVVLLVEAKGGHRGQIMGNFLAAHDDVVKRVRIKEGRKFATGFSAGARGCSLFPQARAGFGGIVLQGAGAVQYKGNFDVDGIKRNPNVYVAITMGKDDTNRLEVDRMKAAIPKAGQLRTFEFDGNHVWTPRTTFNEAMGWLEQQNGM